MLAETPIQGQPDYKPAARLLDAITGKPGQAVTFQTFDDRGERFNLAGWYHGKLAHEVDL
jgi:hypothetical protein